MGRLRLKSSVRITSFKTFLVLFCVLLVTFSCAPKHVATEGPSGTAEVLVSGITFDDKGLPVMGRTLTSRPSGAGDHFAIVRFAGDKPVTSYDIVVRRQRPDFGKPFRTVYEWTGKGFELGANISGVVAQGEVRVHDRRGNDDAAVELAIIVTPVAVGTAGGFVVGILDGIRQAAVELSKLVLKGETVVTCTTYEYDALFRLAYMRMFTPDLKQELVRTEFTYEGPDIEPSRTVIKSLVEGKERVIP